VQKEPETLEELKAAITELEIETGRGLWNKVTFEEISGDEPWSAAEAAIGSKQRDVLYVGIEGLRQHYRGLVDFKTRQQKQRH